MLVALYHEPVQRRRYYGMPRRARLRPPTPWNACALAPGMTGSDGRRNGRLWNNAKRFCAARGDNGMAYTAKLPTKYRAAAQRAYAAAPRSAAIPSLSVRLLAPTRSLPPSLPAFLCLHYAFDSAHTRPWRIVGDLWYG